MFYTKLEFRVTCAFVYIYIYVCMYVLVALEKGIKFLVWTWGFKISVWRIINSTRNINFNNTWHMTIDKFEHFTPTKIHMWIKYIYT